MAVFDKTSGAEKPQIAGAQNMTVSELRGKSNKICAKALGADWIWEKEGRAANVFL